MAGAGRELAQAPEPERDLKGDGAWPQEELCADAATWARQEVARPRPQSRPAVPRGSPRFPALQARGSGSAGLGPRRAGPVSYTHLRAHETVS